MIHSISFDRNWIFCDACSTSTPWHMQIRGKKPIGFVVENYFVATKSHCVYIHYFTSHHSQMNLSRNTQRARDRDRTDRCVSEKQMRLNVNCKRWQKLLLISFYSVFVYNYHVRVFEKFAREVDLRERELRERQREQHKNINRIVCIMAKRNSGDNSSSSISISS